MIYAAYGMNTNPDVMAALCPNACFVGTAWLDGWKFTMRNVATIEISPGSSVPLIVWNITDECVTELDFLEGFPTMYNKMTICDNSFGNMMLYVMNANYYPVNPPTWKYAKMIEEGLLHFEMPIGHVHEAINESIAFRNERLAKGMKMNIMGMPFDEDDENVN